MRIPLSRRVGERPGLRKVQAVGLLCLSAMLGTPTLLGAPSAAFPTEAPASSEPGRSASEAAPKAPEPVPETPKAPAPSRAVQPAVPSSPPTAPATAQADPTLAPTAPRTEGDASEQLQQLDLAASFGEKYEQAREQLLRGEFKQAATAFAELANRAHTPVDRALAHEMAQLAEAWAKQDLAFVRRADLGESSLSDKAVNRRTTDEIAVLYTNAVFYGIGTGGWIATHTEPDSAAGFILPSLLFAGAAAGAVAVADLQKPLGYGVPQSIVSGLYIGLEQGLAWTLWNQARVNSVDEWSATTFANVIWGFSTVGAVAGGVVGTVGGTTPGRASWVGSTALWTGLVAGLGAAALSPENEAQDERALLAGALGLNAGAVIGALVAGRVSPSIARVRFLDLGGIGGSLLVGGLYVAVAKDRPEVRAGAAALSLGMAGGLTAAWFATQGLARDDTAPGAGVSALPSTSPTLRASLLPVPGGVALGASGEL